MSETCADLVPFALQGYGASGMGPIPANAVLLFETELVSINGEKQGAETREL